MSGAAQKYPTLSLEQLSALPIKRLGARDAICFLWATTPMGRDPYVLLEDHWGFEYKTEWYWHKVGRLGTGYWTRGAVEKLLIGVRGRVPAWRSSFENWLAGGWTHDEEAFAGVLEAKPEGHSRKPVVARTMIEALTQGARRVELFSTQPEVPHWTHYGLAIDRSHNVLDSDFWKGLFEAPDVEPASRPSK